MDSGKFVKEEWIGDQSSDGLKVLKDTYVQFTSLVTKRIRPSTEKSNGSW